MKVNIETARAMVHDDCTSWTVEACDADGRQYYRMDLFLSSNRATDLAKQVADAGAINVELWQCHTPYGTAAWLLDGLEQRQIEDERFGYF